MYATQITPSKHHWRCNFFLFPETQKGIVFCNVIASLQVSVSDSNCPWSIAQNQIEVKMKQVTSLQKRIHTCFQYRTTHLPKLGSISKDGRGRFWWVEMVKRTHSREKEHSFTSSVFRKRAIMSFDFLGTMEGSKCTSRQGSEFRKVVIH